MRGLLVLAVVSACSFNERNIQISEDAATDAEPDAGPAAFLTGWRHRKQITIQASKVSAPAGETGFAGFPIVVSGNDPDIQTAALPTGADLVFTNTDGVTLLVSELELYLDGSFVAWVKIPVLSSVDDTEIYLYYGNPAPPAQSSSTTVWAQHVAVWHFDEDPGPGGAAEIRDSAAPGFHGTADASMTSANRIAGQLGRGLEFDGIDDFIALPTITLGNVFTILAWVNVEADADSKTVIANGATDGFRLQINSAGTSDGRLVFQTADSATTDSSTTDVNVIPSNVWKHVAVAIDRVAGLATLYVDGVQRSIEATTLTNYNTTSTVEIGRMKQASLSFKGRLDEVVLHNDKLSPERIATTFANQSQPFTFYTVGPEEDAP